MQQHECDLDDDGRSPAFRHLFSSFKRETDLRLFPTDHLTPATSATASAWGGNSQYDDQGFAPSGLARKLKGRHLQMIAIGGSIGTGLFVASGKALQAGGPGSLLLAYSVVGVMLYCTCQALCELAVMFPIAGSFAAWSTRFLDPSWGFAMGWKYVEVPDSACMTIRYWNDKLPSAIFVTIFLALLLSINLAGVKAFGEAEFIFSIIKVVAIIGFILLGIVLNCGGTPDRGYIGGEFWHDPGAFNNGFKGLCSVFVTATFAYGGTELIGLAAAETVNPRKSLPSAVKQVFWRIALFYVIALTLVGLLVPYNDPRLVEVDYTGDTNASPFVIAIEEAGIQVLPSVMNAVILIAVLSVGNSAIFGSSRTLAALANLHQAPKPLGYIDRRGRPLVAIALAAVLGLLAYLADVRSQSNVLDWLLSVSGLSTIFTWASILLCHIRFRRAWSYHGRSTGSLPFRAQLGVLGSYIGLTLTILILLAQFWVGAVPVGAGQRTASEIAQNLFLRCMGVPIIVSFYVLHKVICRTTYVRAHDMDIDTGRRDFNGPILLAQEDEEKASWPRWKTWYKFLC
ncbi:zinc finger domain-containing protein [Purpureocillium lavendulum]|uniref:Zinc finger domain-containing protein n=1 Tax=Purpureocillium lavendulum TaxID=1247861 RepID=A0AB34FP52_9HYPO|nr:zinc finger domain-containing protein [Purpureocillium lavendulum]